MVALAEDRLRANLKATYLMLRYNFKQMMGGYGVLKGPDRWFFNHVCSQKFYSEYEYWKIKARNALSRQIEVLNYSEMARKNPAGYTERMLIQRAFEALIPSESDEPVVLKDMYETHDNSRHEDVADDKLDKICDFFDRYDVNPTGKVLLTWIGFAELGFDAHVATYQALKIAVADFLQYYPHWRTFQIEDPYWRLEFKNLRSEYKRGDTKVSITEKAALQAMVLGVVLQKDIDEQIYEDYSIRSFLMRSSRQDALGYLSHIVMADGIGRMVDDNFARLTRFSLMTNALMKEFDAVPMKASEMELLASPMGSYYTPFQVLPFDSWNYGEINGKVRLQPYKEFEFMPTYNRNGICYYSGTTGSGKTTLAAGVATLTVKDKKGFVFVALGDNTNSYELASMPLMNLPKCKGTYEILTKKLRIPPRGFPLLMLNVVESLDELENVPLTKYDRVLVVPAHDFFKFDFQILVDELESIAREPEFKGEYNGPRGIIACRNIRRRVKASKKSKEVSVEIAVASQLLNNFGDWRTAPKGNHMSIPVRIQFDEGGRAGANIVSSSEQSFLKGIIEQLSEDSRKWNIGLDFLTNLVVEVNKTLRELAMNVFFGRLEVQSQEAKSPLDSLLGSFSIEEVEKENVKDLTKNGYLRSGTHLMFWYNKDLGSINMIQPVIPPFQSRIEDTSNYELQKAYVEEYKATDYFVDKPLKIWYAGSEKMEESSKSEVTLL